MFKRLGCYLAGLHAYDVRCAPGAIYLHCAHCGRRSEGWQLAATPQVTVTAPREAPSPRKSYAPSTRVVSFHRPAVTP